MKSKKWEPIWKPRMPLPQEVKLGPRVHRDVTKYYRKRDKVDWRKYEACELLKVAREVLGVTIRCLGYGSDELGTGWVRFQIGESVWRYDMLGDEAVMAYKISRYSPGRALAWTKKHKLKEIRERHSGCSKERGVSWDTEYMSEREGGQGWEWPKGDEDLVSEITHVQHSCVP